MTDMHADFHAVYRQRRILVVDDEAINRELLGMMLRDEYEVLFAETGREALEAIRTQADTISLVLLDLNLPDIHGLEILRRIKADPLSGKIPVIVLTSDRDAEVESLTIGASDFIPKPYPMPKVVLARVLRTIELSEDRDLIRWTERDQLTGLYNRDYFYRYAAQYDTYHKEQPMDAIVVDINHFHMLNERYGKAYGDGVLRHIGEHLRVFVRDAGGMVCRRSGDTFLIYCPHMEDYSALLEDALHSLTEEGVTDSRVRLRMGVYAMADKSIDIERRFDRAKLAADSVRNSLSAPIAIYDSAMHESEVFAEQLLDGYERAIAEKQFQVYYQPKYNIRPAVPVLSSAEALVRWKHPELGMISPGVFIPLFENNGLIPKLDRYVWREAARQIREWRDTLGIAVPVSVNVSRVDMFDPHLVEDMIRLVEEFGLSRTDLLLEITESAYTQDSDQIIRTVRQLQEAGFLIEMDDFGSGYSSLNMISTLPIDALKLDMQLIRNAFNDRRSTRMLEIVIDIADSLSVPTIAEGVETAEQMLTLKTMGCDTVQGYYFSRPVPAAEFEKFLLERKAAEEPKPVRQARKPAQAKAQDPAAYDALHDPLTGLYNANAFDMLLKDADHDHIAVLIADIDGLNAISDQYGREVRDRAIRLVADVLRNSFRSVDHVCRIRKDEFVVIMSRMDSSLRQRVFEKVEQVNERLRHHEESLPPLSLSVGIAFADRENPQGDIFQDADTALFRMREVRSTGCAIY